MVARVRNVIGRTKKGGYVGRDFLSRGFREEGRQLMARDIPVCFSNNFCMTKMWVVLFCL